MPYRRALNDVTHRKMRTAAGIAAIVAMCTTPIVSAQGRWDREWVTRLDPGTLVSVRTNDTIDSSRVDYEVFTGTVDRDVHGDNGRLAIPRGSTVELIVRSARDNDLVLDMESVVVNGRRYALSADPNRIASNDIVGSIVGAISGGHIRGRGVLVPRGTAMTFRLERPLMMGVADRGIMRDGRHYHDFYRDDRDR